jgi:hypothetical protein
LGARRAETTARPKARYLKKAAESAKHALGNTS